MAELTAEIERSRQKIEAVSIAVDKIEKVSQIAKCAM